jgi:hypothetical protein
MEVTVQHWWNGSWGRLARYDLWLKKWVGPTRTTWRVEAQRGGIDSKRFWASNDIADEADARALLDHLRQIRPGRWMSLDRG